MKVKHNIISKRSQAVIDYAVDYAGTAHSAVKQFRKYTNQPYIVHPIAVALKVSQITEDVDMIVAAILHDLIEDTHITYHRINNKFGLRAADFVLGLTEFSMKADGNRVFRKALDARYLGRQCHQVQTIKCADLIDNTSTILEYDPAFAKIYMAEKETLLNHLIRADAKIWQEAKDIVDKYYKEYPIS